LKGDRAMAKYPGIREYRGKRGTSYYMDVYDADGKRRWKKADGARTKAEAAKMRRELLQKIEKEGWRKPEAVLLRDYLIDWLRHHAALNNLNPRSVRAYEFVVDRLIAGLGSLTIEQANNVPRLNRYVRERLEMGYDAKTVNKDLGILQLALDRAVADNKLHDNKLRYVDRPKAKPYEWRILTPVEVARVEREFEDERAMLIFLVQSRLGLRRGETQNLRWRDFEIRPEVKDGEARITTTLRVVESKSEAGRRALAVPGRIAQALFDYRLITAYSGDDEYVFAHPRTGGKFRGDWYSEEFRKAREKAGIEGYMRPCHDTRHTAITNLAAGGTAELHLSAIAGHSKPAMTRHYTHLGGEVFPDDMEALDARLSGGLPTKPSTDQAETEDPVEALIWPEQERNGTERPH
jgi:integrase